MEKIKIAYNSLVVIALSTIVFNENIPDDSWVVLGLVEIALMIYLAYAIYKQEAQELKVPVVVLNLSLLFAIVGAGELIGIAMFVGIIWLGIKLYGNK